MLHRFGGGGGGGRRGSIGAVQAASTGFQRVASAFRISARAVEPCESVQASCRGERGSSSAVGLAHHARQLVLARSCSPDSHTIHPGTLNPARKAQAPVVALVRRRVVLEASRRRNALDATRAAPSLSRQRHGQPRGDQALLPARERVEQRRPRPGKDQVPPRPTQGEQPCLTNLWQISCSCSVWRCRRGSTSDEDGGRLCGRGVSSCAALVRHRLGRIAGCLDPPRKSS